MPKLSHLSVRFPKLELAIHRRYARDPEFRGICDDYEEAVTALRYWQAAGTPDDVRTEDFRRLAAEIEAEIIAMLEGSPGRHPDD